MQPYNFFIQAARGGNVDTLNALLARGGFEVTADQNYALCVAARNGHLALVERLLQIPTVVEQVTADDNGALRRAALGGHLTVVERLLEIPAVVEQAAAKNNDALRWAAFYGQLAVVERLLQIPAVVEQATADDNRALGCAAENGHLVVVERLLQIPAVVEQAAADNNCALCAAAENGHLAVVERLLQIPAVEEQATADDNYALREAALNGHLAVRDRLLEIPSVRAAVLAADNVSGDLRALAQNRENAMRALNLHEQGIVNALRARYPHIGDGAAQIQALKTFLEGQCQKAGVPVECHPSPEGLANLQAFLATRNQASGPSLRDEGVILLNQLQSPAHRAWRYLFARPNPLMSPNASFVEVTEEGRQASIWQNDWQLIALLWALLTDESAERSNGFILEHCQETFIETLALLNRAHNYDHNQETDDGDLDKPSCSMGVTQRLLFATTGFAIADNPDTRPLGATYLDKRFKEQLITPNEKGLKLALQALSTEQLKTIQAALDDIICGEREEELTQEKKNALATLKTIRISETDVNEFIASAREYYSDLRFGAYRDFDWLGTRYADIPAFINALAQNPYEFYFSETFEAVNQVLASRPVEPDHNVIVDAPVYTPSRKRPKRDDDEDGPSNLEPEAKRARTDTANGAALFRNR
jgi:ankyrin repeat protein